MTEADDNVVARRRAIATIYQDSTLGPIEKQKMIAELMKNPITTEGDTNKTTVNEQQENGTTPENAIDLTKNNVVNIRRRLIAEAYQDDSLSPSEKREKIEELVKAPAERFVSNEPKVEGADQKETLEQASSNHKDEGENKPLAQQSSGLRPEGASLPNQGDEEKDHDDYSLASDSLGEFSDHSDLDSQGEVKNKIGSFDDEYLDGEYNEDKGGKKKQVLLDVGKDAPELQEDEALFDEKQDKTDTFEDEPALDKSKDVNKDEDDDEDDGDPRRRRFCSLLFFAILLLILTLSVGLSVNKSEPTTIPTLSLTTNPTEEPTKSKPVLEYEPPTKQDCAAMAQGLKVEGQENMSVVKFDVAMDVVMDSKTGVDRRNVFLVDPYLDILEGKIQKILVPSLAGCSESQRRLSGDREPPLLRGRGLDEKIDDPLSIFYVIGGANVTVVNQPGKSCEPENEGECYRAKAELDLYLKGDESDLTLIHIIGFVFGNEPLVSRFDLESPFVKVDVININLRSRNGEDPTDSPTVAPSSTPTAKPSFRPTSRPTNSPTITREPTRTPSGQPTSTSSPTCHGKGTASAFFEQGKVTAKKGKGTNTMKCNGKTESDIGVFFSDNFNCDMHCLGTLNATEYDTVCTEAGEITFSLPSEYRDVTLYYGYLNDTMATNLICEDNVALECAHVGQFFEKGIYEDGDGIVLQNEDKNGADLYSFDCDEMFTSDIAVLTYDEVTCEVQCLGSKSVSEYEHVCNEAGAVTFYLDEEYDPESLFIGYLDEDVAEAADLKCEKEFSLKCPDVSQYFLKKFNQVQGGVDQEYKVACNNDLDLGILVLDENTCELQCYDAFLSANQYCAGQKDFKFTAWGDFQDKTLYMGLFENGVASELSC